MKKEDAIKYLKQLYPNGGHCWLDEQRMEAIGMAVKALQKEPVSNDKVIDKEKLHQILSSLWRNDDKDGNIYYNKAIQDIQMAIDLQEEPAAKEYLCIKDFYPYEKGKVYKSIDGEFPANAKKYFKLIEVYASEDKMTISKEWFEHCKKSWYNEGYIDGEYNRDRQFEKPVSEDFEEALAKEWKGYNDRGAATVDALEDNTQELAFAKGFYRGTKWKAEQFEKERLKQCDTLTKEQAKIEQDFVVNFIKKNNCTPTFIDAIEYGMKMQKEQMMAKVVDGIARPDDDEVWCDLKSFNFKDGDKVKVIVIKKD